MADITNRRVLQIDPKQDVASGATLRIFDVLNRDLVILLGDPGAGKTHCFTTMAAKEGAPVYSVRAFIARAGDVQAPTIYLDGLDEYRPRNSARDTNAIIPLLQTLRRSGNPRLRLSCRFADWLGSTDLELFRDYCVNYAVVALQALDYEEGVQVLTLHNMPQPDTFLREANARGMGWTVSNAQTLLMLADVVQHSGWPTTRRELYEQWSFRHLTEQKETLQESNLGQYAPVHLLDPAGAACAALLISDVMGIRRSPVSDEQVPSYQTVPFSNQEMVLAALNRGAFTSVSPDIVTYVHRTIAEYLGARWLGKQVSGGLPLSRVQALLGVDAHPVPSLSGLHAWLPVFTSLQASTLIAKDPIGILTYGDAASLSPFQKAELIKSIGTVAAENAWFLNDGVSDYGLAGLFCQETAEQLLTILKSPAEPASLKTLVLRAISVGEPLARYRADLEHLLADPSALSRHRKLAFQALLRYGVDGSMAIKRLYASQIGGEHDSIGLRATIVGSLYGQSFGATDVMDIFADAKHSPSQVIGELWPLDHGIPVHSLLEVLEEYVSRAVVFGATAGKPADHDVESSIERMIVRLCESIPDDDIGRVDRFLKVLRVIYEKTFGLSAGNYGIDKVLSRRPRLLQALIDSAVRSIEEFEYPAMIGFTLNRITGGAATMEMLAERLCIEFNGYPNGTLLRPDMLRKFEAFGRCLWNCGPQTAYAFEKFMEVGNSHAECKALLDGLTQCEVNKTKFQQSAFDAAVAEYRAQVRGVVEREIDALQSGEALGRQGQLSMLYWGFDNGASGHIRRKLLILAIGEQLTEAVEQGFIALIKGQPAPSLQEIAELNADDIRHMHWYAFLAGMDLFWESKQNFGVLSPETLLAVFAFSLLLDTFDDKGQHCTHNDREWSQAIVRERPEIAEEVCTTLLFARIRHGKTIDFLLRSLPISALAPWRSNLAVQLLSSPEMINISDLEELALIAAESDDGREQLAIIAGQQASVTSAESREQNRIWVVIGFALCGDEFEVKLKDLAAVDQKVLWTLKSLTQYSQPINSQSTRLELNLHQAEFVVTTFGPLFPSTTGRSDRWGGQSDYDATLYLSGLVLSIAAQPDIAAGECLKRLLQHQQLASYHPLISSGFTSQRELNRQARYEKPSWNAVCAAVQGGLPANIEDLKALFLDNLISAIHEIRHSNLDRYRVYWTGTRFKCGVPRDEEYCRDRLTEFLRERMEPLGLWVEPEGHMAADKRADIVVYSPHSLKLPVEVKRDTHPELWLAAQSQLERLYTRDPQAQGYGVYLVFYFGPNREGRITAHPEGTLLTDSPEELKKCLTALVPAEHRDKISCAVIDVSCPQQQNKTAKQKRAKASKVAKPAKKETNTRVSKPKGTSLKAKKTNQPKRSKKP